MFCSAVLTCAVLRFAVLCYFCDFAQDVSGAGMRGLNESIPEWQHFLDVSLGTRIDSALQDAPIESNVHTCWSMEGSSSSIH